MQAIPSLFYQLQISWQNLRNPFAQEYSLCWEVCQACPTRDSQNLRPKTRFIGPFTFSEQSNDIPPITTSSSLRREHIFPTLWFWGPNPHGVTGSWRRLEKVEPQLCNWLPCWGSRRLLLLRKLQRSTKSAPHECYIVSPNYSWHNSNPSLLLDNSELFNHLHCRRSVRSSCSVASSPASESGSKESKERRKQTTGHRGIVATTGIEPR